MRVLVTGLRGLPNVEGGIESHAERLYPRLAELGCDIEVAVRSRYQVTMAAQAESWKQVRLKRFWSPAVKELEAFVHTFIVTLYAIATRPQIFHIHAVGPSLFALLARVFGLNVVVTHHGQDYDREKWSGFAKWALRACEQVGMRWASARIVITETLRTLVRNKYDLDSIVIPNGIDLHPLLSKGRVLTELNLQSRKYVLHVGRFVPEKRHLDLIEAFETAELSGWQLVLVGSIDENDTYCATVQNQVTGRSNVVFTGFRTGLELTELYSNAGLFVLPSSHEGLPLALLEALSFGLIVIASDIPANLEIGLDQECYVGLGNLKQLSERIRFFASRNRSQSEIERLRQWVAKKYSWDDIARKTFGVYRSVLVSQSHSESSHSEDPDDE